MANTFIYNTDFIAEGVEAGSLFLGSKLGLTDRVSSDVENSFSNKVGDTVYVKVKSPMAEAGEYSGTVTASDITETKVPVKLRSHLYKATEITSKQKSLEIKDFAQDVIFPLVESVANKIDSITKGALVAGIGDVTGTAGTEPSTLAHIIAGVEQLKQNKVPQGNGYQGVITTGTWANFANLTEFKSTDYGAGKAENLRAGQLSGIVGVKELFDTDKLGTFARGDVAGTVLTASPTTGGSSLSIDGLTSATGTIYAGNRVTIADDTSSTTYRVLEDATISSNAATLTVYPNVDSSVGDNKAVTFQTAVKESLVFAKQAICTAVVAPAPLATASNIINYNGMSMRYSVINSGLEEKAVVDAFVGSMAVQPDGIVCFQG